MQYASDLTINRNDEDLIITGQYQHKTETELTKGIHPFASKDHLPERTSLNALFTFYCFVNNRLYSRVELLRSC